MASKSKQKVWMEEHFSYEVEMFTHSLAAMKRENITRPDYNMAYESFAIHARNLYDFLTNRRPSKGESNNFRAKDFCKDFKAGKDENDEKVGSIFDRLHKQVLHMGKTRSNFVKLEDCETLAAWINKQLAAFKRVSPHSWEKKQPSAQYEIAVTVAASDKPSATGHVTIVQSGHTK